MRSSRLQNAIIIAFVSVVVHSVHLWPLSYNHHHVPRS
ncbi:Protein of unknown function [Pyronema omphalodes CBS 100304]|uniref:Uncharacterized protein n=1 Tax=Pyronema omphalodes (strain CBS 100304) TaxID=1076935 RepID=U4L373_PYROM|nr:Protein of unknown function [Pyronema omphalodes CBS 100304]